ncbi:MAG TPA: hypothetical protein IGR64_13745 [Leptolyngbyaceae cyanobacterium M65_K2018_010]|nr:hypothetical protein [Leptolyngbyaceae cyanobacterium M65_K2018_010]
MAIKPSQYETLLSTCTNHRGALELLKRYRPYLEAVPSMRRPQDSILTLPLPNIRVRAAAHLNPQEAAIAPGAVLTLPCDLALLMCDPEWKIKTGVEIFVFIHRPLEDFSDLLRRWRHTQILLDRGYEWLLPHKYQHLLSDGSDSTHPLFVLFPETPDRILKGLVGAGLPAVVYPFQGSDHDEIDTPDGQGVVDIPDLEDMDANISEDGAMG